MTRGKLSQGDGRVAIERWESHFDIEIRTRGKGSRRNRSRRNKGNRRAEPQSTRPRAPHRRVMSEHADKLHNGGVVYAEACLRDADAVCLTGRTYTAGQVHRKYWSPSGS